VVTLVNGSERPSSSGRNDRADRSIDPDLLRFVQSLAIADARRDAAALVQDKEAAKDEARGNLREVLDRPAE
jgi:hypothetical protein